ncbi:copper resistance CopC family protein [Phytoactinopolyspora endophytica]|uniref:copper resistance CopC family protein n=1 Tax=Phytoactinopolyspora endophytica TaxID=1642495 RepID=UPI0013EB61C2|nr:copper resistance CopC family protein [Phytoactinopolyspora endophytica]
MSSTPEDGATVDDQPGTIELVFNENVQDQPDFTQMAVLDADEDGFHAGDPVIDGNTVLQDVSELPDGDYTVSYRVVSADGHPVSGTVEFTMTAGDDGATDDDAEQEQEQEPAVGADTDQQAGDDASEDGVDDSVFIGGAIVVAMLAGLALLTARSRRRLRESSDYGMDSTSPGDGAHR